MEFQSKKEYRSKKEEVINKFNGDFIKNYYQYDPMLHAIIEMLTRDGDPYEIIQQLIEERSKNSKILSDYVMRFGSI